MGASVFFSEEVMMQVLYISASILAFIGVIMLWLGFAQRYHELTGLQKAALLVTTVGVLIPLLAGFVAGWLGH